ncbi:NlpC/P60 family protein [Aliiroseovarius sp. KMU-50]|uniref:NlpC/P60 family protein n=1 Tax=Aliiroseovarius salicola TaxID=3009082 RepID=A0ABT4VWJ2_9RHOB|nr:NlpC/P60 family protein [Aliiroseovarius sp. KMU-50]MDA5092602.1 NlpC/P60 family protein [Aliiroseovarius sp. KMU-50]
MSDPRLTPANPRVAHETLRGLVKAQRFTPGMLRRVITPVADILRQPNGPRDRQALYGEQVLMLEEHEGHAFVQAERDGYVGYMDIVCLGSAQGATHWVSAAATHLYPEPDFKIREDLAISFGSRLTIVADHGRFCETEDGLFVPSAHLTSRGDFLRDPAQTAGLFLGTPYLWGGNSRAGIDCSGLVQAALLAAGIDCPADSDMQEKIGRPIPDIAPLARGDFLFWKGHVAMVFDHERLIHANAHHMAVALEKIEDAKSRIENQGDGPVTARRRLW